MDSNRFDDIAKTVANGISRRRALQIFGGVLGAVAGALRTEPAGANPPPKHCKFQGYNCKTNANCCSLNCCNRTCCGDGQTCCGGQCWGACQAGEQRDEFTCRCVPVSPPPEVCQSPADCAPPPNECQEASCVNGQCGFVNLELGDQTCGVGACQRTVARCIGGQPQTCVPGTATAEVCNGVDDDCDGVVDNGAPCLDGQSCIGGACRPTPTCTPNGTGCSNNIQCCSTVCDQQSATCVACVGFGNLCGQCAGPCCCAGSGCQPNQFGEMACL